MNRLEINNSETMKIEIGESGKYIELNPLDIDFPIRIEKAAEKMEKAANTLKQEWIIIEKRQDVKDGLLSRNLKDKMVKYKEYNDKCGQIVDELFGEGTTKAAFGDKSYFGMFDDLFASLKPFVEEVYGNPEAVLERVKHKYSKQDEDVLK